MIRNLAPKPKKLEFEYVDMEQLALGSECEGTVDIYVFPLTVQEDMEITQVAEKYQLKSGDGPEAKEIKYKKLIESAELLLFYTMKKHFAYTKDLQTWNDEAIWNLVRNEMNPDWQNKITREVYLFKGIDLDMVKKKQIERKLDEM